MEKYLEKLILSVAQGNPGALMVIRELQWFSRWEKMLRYFEEIKLTGADLYEKVADEYHKDVYAFGHDINKEIIRKKAKESKKLKIKIPPIKF